MGADPEPGRRLSVGGERRGSHRSGPLRSGEAARADHADDGPVAADGPGVREDLATLLRASGPVRRRFRPRVVQADAPRHGSDRALSRPARSEGDADLAGSDPGGGPSADQRRGHRSAEGENPRLGPLGSRARLDGLGVGVDVPRRRQARRRQRRAHSPCARRRTGRSTSRLNWRRCLQTLEAIQKEFNASASGGKKVSLADLIVLGGGAAIEKAAKDAGHDVKVPFTPGRIDASQDQTDVEFLRAARAQSRRVPQLSQRRRRRLCRPRNSLWTRRNLLSLTAPQMTVLVGGLRVLGANVGKSRSTASSPSGPER